MNRVIWMMSKYGVLLKDAIQDERKQRDYQYGKHDKALLKQMLKEVNKSLSVNLHYLAEIDHLNVNGAGEIYARYISDFESESVRAYLVPQIAMDRVPNAASLLYELYLHFQSSDDYIAYGGDPAPAHIYARYDNAFSRLKPKKLRRQMTDLVSDPRNAFYLPFTTRMVASWKDMSFMETLLRYLDSSNLNAKDFGIAEGHEGDCCPSLSFMQYELQFRAIDGLRYFPYEPALSLIADYLRSPDKNVQAAALKTMKYWKSKRNIQDID